MSEWQKIETAPKDTVIDVWAVHVDGLTTRIPGAIQIHQDGWWVDGRGRRIPLHEGKWKLSHWMPLPEPPKP